MGPYDQAFQAVSLCPMIVRVMNSLDVYRKKKKPIQQLFVQTYLERFFCSCETETK